MTATLVITSTAAREIVQHCKEAAPSREACGFVVGKEGVGTRTILMKNVHPEPERRFRMDDEQVVNVMAYLDVIGEDVLAMWHSHTDSEPILSVTDVAAIRDTSLAYLVVSLAGGRVRTRAYRIDVPFIGMKQPREVFLQVGEIEQPDGPWSLTPGNHVTIGYVRPGRGTTLSFVSGTITSVTEGQVSFDKDRPGLIGPSTIGMDRIRQVTVHAESDAASRVRAQMSLNARHLVAALGTPDATTVPAIVAALAAAFPVGITAVQR